MRQNTLFGPSQKKGQMGGVLAVVAAIAGIAITFGIAIMAAALAVDVVDSFSDGLTANSLAANATDNGLYGMENFTDDFTTIGTVIGAVVLIGLVVGGLGVFVGSRIGG